MSATTVFTLPESALEGDFWTPHGVAGKTTLAPAGSDTHNFPGSGAGSAGFIPKQYLVANVGANAMTVVFAGHEVEVPAGKNIRIAGQKRSITVASTLGTDYVLMASAQVLPQMNYGAN